MARPTLAASYTFARARKTVQLVASAMMGGLVVMSGVVYALLGTVPPVEGASTALLLTGAALSIGSAALGFIMPSLLVRQAPEQNLPLRMQSLVFGKILFAASFEGAGLYWAVAALVLDQPLCLIGPAAAILVFAAFFPTSARLEAALGLSEAEVDRRFEALRARA